MRVVAQVVDQVDHCAFRISARRMGLRPIGLALIHHVEIGAAVADCDHLVDVVGADRLPCVSPVGDLKVPCEGGIPRAQDGRWQRGEVAAEVLGLADAEVAEHETVPGLHLGDL
jgi:hypothetical protein